ncbi:hypothetical protein D3C86_1831070 [compost metagenome]
MILTGVDPLVLMPVNSPGKRMSVVLSPLAVNLSFEHPINRMLTHVINNKNLITMFLMI